MKCTIRVYKITADIHCLSVEVEYAFGKSIIIYINPVVRRRHAQRMEWYIVVFCISFRSSSGISINCYIRTIIYCLTLNCCYRFWNIQRIKVSAVRNRPAFHCSSSYCKLCHKNFGIKRFGSDSMYFIGNTRMRITSIVCN